jgi:hypothetical protein
METVSIREDGKDPVVTDTQQYVYVMPQNWTLCNCLNSKFYVYFSTSNK